jgi:ribonuclease PH
MVTESENFMRIDGRKVDELRQVKISPGYLLYPEGSVLISMGLTKVICTATIQESIPRWKKEQKVPGGWITAEYAMLPRSTHDRKSRETRGLGGRTQEIRRLIGRSLRASVDLEKLGERTCLIDCDVIQADGGTRTASITGGYIALAIALDKLKQENKIPPETSKTPIAAISVGVVDEVPMLDLCYMEDSSADVDVNVVMTAGGKFIEVQSTAEGDPFSRSTFSELLDLAIKGIGELFEIQASTLEYLKTSKK